MDYEFLRKTFIYDSKAGELIWKRDPEKPNDWNGRMAGKKLGGMTRSGHKKQWLYKACTVSGKSHPVGHLIWLYHGGAIPFGKIVRTYTGDGMDTRIENLFVGDRSGAQARRFSLPKSGYKGVYKHRHKFKAEIMIQGQKLYLGLFSTAEQAAEAYDFAAFQAHGNNAALNEGITKRPF